MSVRPVALAVGLAALLCTATLTFAAAHKLSATPHAAPVIAPKQQTLVVPDVRRQAYVFAKGMLEDAGFAWRVQGAVHGFATNVVATQSPAPGTRVLDNGEPTILLTLSRNAKYGQKGTPEDVAPYPGAPVRLADLTVAPVPKTVAPKQAAAAAKPAEKAAPKVSKYPQHRPPAFAVAGAPAEPLDEMPLPDRARLLDRWLGTHPKPTDANVRHWLYQNAWVVEGAKFGWWRGGEALRLLIDADRRTQSEWGIGAKSEAVARAALAKVEARSK